MRPDSANRPVIKTSSNARNVVVKAVRSILTVCTATNVVKENDMPEIEDADIYADLSGGKLLIGKFRNRIADLKAENQQLKAENESLRELLSEAQCPDILYCNNGVIEDAWGNKGKCPWCKQREQALKGTQ